MKKFILALTALTAAASVCAFTACGGENDDPAGTKTYTFEAEGVDLSEQSGHGLSNNESGCGMIQGKNTTAIKNNKQVLSSISGEYFVGYFGTLGTELIFEITAEAEAEECTLILRLASEWGTMTVDDSVMKIMVNDVKLDYTPFTVQGSSIASAAAVEYGVPFKDFTISTKIKLVEGKNVIKLVAQGKDYNGNTSLDIGPGVDCIKIKSTAKLTWESLWEDNQLKIKS